MNLQHVHQESHSISICNLPGLQHFFCKETYPVFDISILQKIFVNDMPKMLIRKLSFCEVFYNYKQNHLTHVQAYTITNKTTLHKITLLECLPFVQFPHRGIFLYCVILSVKRLFLKVACSEFHFPITKSNSEHSTLM